MEVQNVHTSTQHARAVGIRTHYFIMKNINNGFFLTELNNFATTLNLGYKLNIFLTFLLN